MSEEDIWTKTNRMAGYGVSPEAMNRAGTGLYGLHANADAGTQVLLGVMQEGIIGQEKLMKAELERLRNRPAGLSDYEAAWNFAWLGTLARWTAIVVASLIALILLVAYVFGPLSEKRAQALSGLDKWTLNDPARYSVLDPANFNRSLTAKVEAAQPYLISLNAGELWQDTPQMRAAVASLFAAQIDGYRPAIEPGSVPRVTARMLEYQLDLQSRTKEGFTFNDTLPLLLANSGGVESYAYIRDVTLNLAERAPEDPEAKARVAQVTSPNWMAAEKWHLVGRIGMGVRMALGMLKESVFPSRPTG